MVYNRWTKGNHFSRPHFHPNDRYIVVLQGTWWVGSGPKFDPANTTPMPAGSFVTHFAKQVHWDGAKDEDAVLLIMVKVGDLDWSGREIYRRSATNFVRGRVRCRSGNDEFRRLPWS